MPKIKRKDGFYWCREGKEWTVNQWIYGKWFSCGFAGHGVSDSFWDEIDNKILKR